MKRAIASLFFTILMAPACVLAQEGAGPVVVQAHGGIAAMSFSVRSTPVQGAPYSAAITTESVQTLADGNRIVQTFTGSIARDSQGRTRQDASLPAIGNLSAEKSPRLVFIQDPVAQVSYTLNLTDKTAQKMPTPPPPPGGAASGGVIGGGRDVSISAGGEVPHVAGDALFIQAGPESAPGASMPPTVAFQKTFIANDSADAKTEDLGTQTMEGLLVSGTRTTHTIPAGQMGNEQPIKTVTEVWTSPDLKTIVSSKRSDPRMGDQTFQLSDITRTEPDPSLFTVPPDFKIIDGPQKILYGISK